MKPKIESYFVVHQHYDDMVCQRFQSMEEVEKYVARQNLRDEYILIHGELLADKERLIGFHY